MVEHIPTNKDLLKERKSQSFSMEIEREFIIRDENQDRVDFKPEKLEEISSSMKLRIQEGLLPNAEDLWVEELPTGEYRLLSGETRDRAAESIGYNGKMGCKVYKNLGDNMRLDLMALANNGRNDLNLWEKARALAKREEAGQTRSHLCALYGLDSSVLSRLLTFHHDCNDDVKSLARLGLRKDINFLLSVNKLDEEEQEDIIVSIKNNTYDPSIFNQYVKDGKKKKVDQNGEVKASRKSLKMTLKAPSIRLIVSLSTVLKKALAPHFNNKESYKKVHDHELVAAFQLVLDDMQLESKNEDGPNDD
jgi:hypothetical protein